MNIFTDVLFLFVFIVALLYFRLPNVINHNYILHEIYLFIAVCAYYYVITLIKKIKNKCRVNPYDLVLDSLSMGLYCVLGYALYVQMMYMDWSKDYFADITIVTNINKRFASIALIIVAFITVIKLISMLFKIRQDDECSDI